MKNIRFEPFMVFGLLAFATLLSAQENVQKLAKNDPNWSQIPLTGSDAKIIAPGLPRFHIGAAAWYPLAGPAEQSFTSENLLAGLYSPGIQEQLFEQLGGEFYPTGPTGNPAGAYTLIGRQNLVPGIRVGVRLGKRFEIGATALHFQQEWSGNFPVAVLRNGQSAPATAQGVLRASNAGVIAETGLSVFLTSGAFRPFLRGGVRALIPTKNRFEAQLVGVQVPLATRMPVAKAALVAGAGFRLVFLKYGFTETSLSWGNLPGGKYGPAAELTLGWSL